MQENIVESIRVLANLAIIFINPCGNETVYKDESTIKEKYVQREVKK